MESSLLTWAVGTGVVAIVFARALHRWADRRTGQRSAVSRRVPLGAMRRLDVTPSPSANELTPCP
jgi:hypothetical protein